jgi:hypothetical protein
MTDPASSPALLPEVGEVWRWHDGAKLTITEVDEILICWDQEELESSQRMVGLASHGAWLEWVSSGSLVRQH